MVNQLLLRNTPTLGLKESRNAESDRNLERDLCQFVTLVVVGNVGDFNFM